MQRSPKTAVPEEIDVLDNDMDAEGDDLDHRRRHQLHPANGTAVINDGGTPDDEF